MLKLNLQHQSFVSIWPFKREIIAVLKLSSIWSDCGPYLEKAMAPTQHFTENPMDGEAHRGCSPGQCWRAWHNEWISLSLFFFLRTEKEISTTLRMFLPENLNVEPTDMPAIRAWYWSDLAVAVVLIRRNVNTHRDTKDLSAQWRQSPASWGEESEKT